MIDRQKINIYRSYDGDGDTWARRGSKNEKSNITDEDWYLLDSLLQDLYLVGKGMCSLEFADLLKAKLDQFCDNEETIDLLRKLAR